MYAAFTNHINPIPRFVNPSRSKGAFIVSNKSFQMLLIENVIQVCFVCSTYHLRTASPSPRQDNVRTLQGGFPARCTCPPGKRLNFASWTWSEREREIGYKRWHEYSTVCRSHSQQQLLLALVKPNYFQF